MGFHTDHVLHSNRSCLSFTECQLEGHMLFSCHTTWYATHVLWSNPIAQTGTYMKCPQTISHTSLQIRKSYNSLQDQELNFHQMFTIHTCLKLCDTIALQFKNSYHILHMNSQTFLKQTSLALISLEQNKFYHIPQEQKRAFNGHVWILNICRVDLWLWLYFILQICSYWCFIRKLSTQLSCLILQHV